MSVGARFDNGELVCAGRALRPSSLAAPERLRLWYAAFVRALHVIAGNLFGGIESFLVTLARRTNGDHDLVNEFALCFDGRLRRELAGLRSPAYDLGAVRTRAPWSVLRARRRLRERLSRGDCDVVVCHSAWAQAVFGAVPHAAGLPVVFYLHDLVRSRHWLERWAGLHRPDWTLTNSQFTARTLSELYPGAPCSVVHYPIEAAAQPLTPEERVALRRELGASDETVVIVQACRMQAWKGHARLLRALGRLPHGAPWLCLEIGGAQRDEERQYQAGLEALTRELGIAERVRFLGQRSDVPRLLSACDIHCQPNATPEPFGIAFVEAMAAGLPVVTFDMGGAREIVESETGFLVRDDDELARRLSELIGNAELRRTLGAKGPARARELCDPERQIAKLAAELRRVAR
jgi:glycosyltransferase involved in cell wall biosynthesis